MKTFVCAVDLEFWSHEPLLWIIIASKDLIWNMSYVRNMLWYFFKNKKIQHYKGTFFLIFFFNTYYFFIRHNFMYLAQYNTFCSEKKKICVCVWGGGSNLMNYLIFGKFMIIQISVRKNVHFMNFSLLFIVFTDVVFEEIRKRQCTKMYTTLHK